MASFNFAHARHPWDCIGDKGDTGNYCRALYHNDFKFCDAIEHDGIKFTCHARTRFDAKICSVIDNRKDLQYCIKLVRQEIKVKNDYAIQVIRKIPHEYRNPSAWTYGK